MGKETKIWECTKCKDDGLDLFIKCEVETGQSLPKPPYCLYGYDTADWVRWHKMYDNIDPIKGKIIGIAGEDLQPGDTIVFKAETVPNCAICKWKDSGLRADINNTGDKFSWYMCNAQGSQDCESVYNSVNCKKLFREK